MKTVLDWMKSNPITVASGLVSVLSILVILFFGLVMNSGLRKDIVAESKPRLDSVTRLTRESVNVPSSDPDQPPITVSGIVITPAIIQDVGGLNLESNKQYAYFQKWLPPMNRNGHAILVDGVFPNWQQLAKPEDFTLAYLYELEAMLGPQLEGQQSAMPRLNAGPGIDPELVQEEVAAFVEAYRAAGDQTGSTGNLSRSDQMALNEEINQAGQEKAQSIFSDYASQYHIYADTREIESASYPLHVQGWAFANTTKQPWQLWEGQLEFWIQQDILRAIQIANEGSANVTQSPIKRLIQLRVVPGYVGLHSQALAMPESMTWSESTTGPLASVDTSRAVGTNSGLSQTNTSSQQQPYAAPITGLLSDRNVPVPANFYAGPTGRVSNAVYDVRHVRLTLMVSGDRGLPALFSALADVNTMSVLSFQLRDIDEYAELRQGFYYGPEDVVEVELVIETIWFRSWMEPYYPSITRQYLGLDPATDIEGASGGGLNDFDSEFPDGEFGPM